MYSPRTLDRVHLGGSDRVFVVTWIDDVRRLADLIPLTGNGPTEQDVPWERLYPVAPSRHAPIRVDVGNQLRNTSDRWSR
jgi:hypothetical protein